MATDSTSARVALALCVLLGLSIGARPARSQAQEGSQAQLDQEARVRFESGRYAFQSGRYEEALADFKRAYELSGRAALLYNIGLAAERCGRREEAIEAYERFLADPPDDSDRRDARARLEALQSGQTQSEFTVETTPTEPSTEVTPADEPSGPRRLWTWVAAGAGVVLGATAVGFWVSANDKYAGLEASCGAVGCSRAEIDATHAPSQVTVTNALLVSSIVVLAGAVVLFFVEGATNRPRTETDVALLRF